MSEQHEVRALLAPMVGGGILLPGRVIAEVVNYVAPETYTDSPAWLLGEMRWSGWQVPMVNLALLAGTTDDERVPDRCRILVSRTLSEATSVVHIGFVINGLPRIKTVTTGNLVEQKTPGDADAEIASGVFSEVSIDEHPAVIPDLDALAAMIESAVYN